MTKKARKEKVLEQSNVYEPITDNIFQLDGSDSDPCFGKENDAKDAVCLSCGDFDICLAATAQSNTKARKAIEAETRFKDVEPEEFIPDLNQWYKFCMDRLFIGIDTIELTDLAKKLNSRFHLLNNGMNKKQIVSYVKQMVAQKPDLKSKVSNGKRFIYVKN